MQDNFGRLVRLCFYGMLILIGFLVAGAQAGSFGVPAVLGISLFLILLAAQINSRMMKSKATNQVSSAGATLANNKGGVITLLVIALVTVFVVIKVFGA